MAHSTAALPQSSPITLQYAFRPANRKYYESTSAAIRKYHACLKLFSWRRPCSDASSYGTAACLVPAAADDHVLDVERGCADSAGGITTSCVALWRRLIRPNNSSNNARCSASACSRSCVGPVSIAALSPMAASINSSSLIEVTFGSILYLISNMRLRHSPCKYNQRITR